MRRYAKVSPRIWTGKLGRALRGDHLAQALAHYLVSGPQATFGGLYELPLVLAAHHLGADLSHVEAAIERLEELGYCSYDRSTDRVWIVEHLRHELGGAPLERSDNRWPHLQKLLAEHAVARELVEALADHYNLEVDPRYLSWSPQTIPRAVRDQVRALDGDICAYCGRTVDWRDRRSEAGGTYDHIDPLGPAVPDNVTVACRGCNSTKGHRTPQEARMTPCTERTQKLLGQYQVEPVSQEQEQEQDLEQEQEQEQQTHARARERRQPQPADRGSGDPAASEMTQGNRQDYRKRFGAFWPPADTPKKERMRWLMARAYDELEVEPSVDLDAESSDFICYQSFQSDTGIDFSDWLDGYEQRFGEGTGAPEAREESV